MAKLLDKRVQFGTTGGVREVQFETTEGDVIIDDMGGDINMDVRWEPATVDEVRSILNDVEDHEEFPDEAAEMARELLSEAEESDEDDDTDDDTDISKDEAVEIAREHVVGQWVEIPKTHSDTTVLWKITGARCRRGQLELERTPYIETPERTALRSEGAVWFPYTEYEGEAVEGDAWTFVEGPTDE